MKKEDLESTMPIKTLKDIEEKTRSSRYLEDDIEEEITRTSKLKEKEAKEEEAIKEEQAEEALAEKNIEEAERLLKEEKEEETTEEEKEPEEKKKENIFNKLLDKYKSLTKKGKIIFFSIVGVVLILIIILLVVLLKKDKPKVEEKPKEEVPVVIVDNFYYKEGKLYLLDETENEIGSYECKNKDEKLCYVAFNNINDDFTNDIILNEEGKELEQRIPIINNQYVFIVDKENENDTTTNMYDITNEKIIEEYEEVKYYSNNQYYIFKDSKDKYGLGQIAEEQNKVLLKATYNYLGMINGKDNLVAEKGDGYHIIDNKGKKLSESHDIGTICDYSKDILIISIQGTYNAYDYNGNLIDGGDFAKALDGYVAFVNNKRLFIKDVNGNKYNEEGISLKTTEYRKTYQVTSGVAKLSKASFTLENTNKAILITVFENDVTSSKVSSIDLTYNKINTKYKYINYFDKKLYFYRDEEKTDLIGSYSCAYQNFTEGVGEDFDKCYVAYDTNIENNDMTETVEPGVSQIYNEKYVFIKDGNSIYLYDLVDKKSLGTYNTISTNSTSKTVEHKDGTYSVILKNSKYNKYGIIEIGETSASKKVAFQYLSMEKLGDYILAKNENSKWVLIKDNIVSSEYPNKIVSYNSNHTLFKVSNSNGFDVYSETAKKLNSTTYKYVELNNSYYVGVNQSNSLSIYGIDGKEITSHGTELKSTDYTGSTPAFIVTYVNSIYTISVKDGDKYIDYQYNTITKSFIGEGAPEPEEEEETEAVG